MVRGTFTRADLERAAKTLEEHNVPPVECPECGARYYVANWDRHYEVRCDCGAVLLEGDRVAREDGD